NAELLKPFQKRIGVKSGRIFLSRKFYLRWSLPLRKAVLRMALQKVDPSLKLSSRLIAQIDKAIENSTSVELPGFLILKPDARTDRIEFSIKPERTGYVEVDVPHEGIFSYPAAQAKLKFSVRDNNRFSTDRSAAYLDAAKVAFPLHIRNWKRGDSFQPLGMKGHKKLSDFWIDRKVPRHERKRIPLIFQEEDLVWVAGYEIDHNYRVTENTKKVLCIKLLKSNV
ncbi:MAG TPA: tRNA lysidine(34) synthetase TilS, partial [Acidobacteriota bacterium]